MIALYKKYDFKKIEAAVRALPARAHLLLKADIKEIEYLNWYYKLTNQSSFSIFSSKCCTTCFILGYPYVFFCANFRFASLLFYFDILIASCLSFYLACLSALFYSLSFNTFILYFSKGIGFFFLKSPSVFTLFSSYFYIFGFGFGFY